MHMLEMAGIVLFLYFFSVALICLYREKINVKIFNLVFVISNAVFFFCWNYAAYQKGWLEKGFMTFDNISPMMFTLTLLIYFMKDGVREYCFSAIACLSFGMFCAMLISPERAYLFEFTQEASFLYTTEVFCHMHASLFGIYLFMTRQVKADVKHLIQAVVFMYTLITFGVFLNHVFHTSFFGMNPYGKYSIYFLDIFHSFPLTLMAYYLGVLLVLTLGWELGAGLERLTGIRKKKIHTGEMLKEGELETEHLQTEFLHAHAHINNTRENIHENLLAENGQKSQEKKLTEQIKDNADMQEK